MPLRALIACSALALMQTHALAGSQFLGKIGMYICDGGEIYAATHSPFRRSIYRLDRLQKTSFSIL
jgi:hypothetical protein